MAERVSIGREYFLCIIPPTKISDSFKLTPTYGSW
jgi:hypothetical protein